MNLRTIPFYFLLVLVALTVGDAVLASATDTPSDPLQQLTSSFPGTVELKNKGRLLEFCPDGTCDGFVTSGSVSAVALKDFAYLYVYFFSDYTFLGNWRNKGQAKKTAERVLSKPEYRNCKNEISREAARCVLRDVSRNGRIRLIFVRYDEGQRNVVRRNIDEQLSEAKSTSK